MGIDFSKIGKIVKEGTKIAWDHKGEVIAVGADVVQGVKNMFKKKNKPISADGIVYDDPATEVSTDAEGSQATADTASEQLTEINNVLTYLAGENEIIKTQLGELGEKYEALLAENQQLKEQVDKAEEKAAEVSEIMETRVQILETDVYFALSQIVKKHVVYISLGVAVVSLITAIVAIIL